MDLNKSVYEEAEEPNLVEETEHTTRKEIEAVQLTLACF